MVCSKVIVPVKMMMMMMKRMYFTAEGEKPNKLRGTAKQRRYRTNDDMMAVVVVVETSKLFDRRIIAHCTVKELVNNLNND